MEIVALIISLLLNGALGYWIYRLKQPAFEQAAAEIKEAAEAVKKIGDTDPNKNRQNKIN
jgi:hypothetical protein|tara:strand:- start:827 stop:1006 length:180 start_codon:yes stop_codon:yes gene_type:complete